VTTMGNHDLSLKYWVNGCFYWHQRLL
jgi:hypothetical protein